MAIRFEEKPCAVCDNGSRFVELVICTDRRIRQPVRTAICVDCGLTFLNPGPTEDSYIEFYRSPLGTGVTPPPVAEVVAKKAMLASLFVRFMRLHAGDLSAMEAVDVGSGWGGFVSRLKPEVKRLACTELMPEAAAFIEQHFGCPCYPAARLTDAFRAQSVDLITLTAVMEHLTDPLAMCRTYFEVLRPGGHLFVFTPDLMGMCFADGIEQYFKFLHPYYYSVNTLQSLLARAGFADFRVWTSRPDFTTRRVRRPLSIEPGGLFLLARRPQTESRQPAMILRDSVDDIRNRFADARHREAAYLRARRVWLHPLVKPLRALARLVPVHVPDKYEPMKAQFDAAFGGGSPGRAVEG